SRSSSPTVSAFPVPRAWGSPTRSRSPPREWTLKGVEAMGMTKRGLGRGLGALIPGAGVAQGSVPVQDLEISALSASPLQPRQEIGGAEFDELVASIRRHGILQPIVARPAN